MKKMKYVMTMILSIVLAFTSVSMPVAAAQKKVGKTASAKHSGFQYKSTNLTPISYDGKRSYVKTQASFEFKGNGRFCHTDVLSHSINNGFMVKSAGGTVRYEPSSVVINGHETDLRDSKRAKKVIGDKKVYNQIMKSGYNKKLKVYEATNGAVYAPMTMTEVKKTSWRAKPSSAKIQVVYHIKKGSYTVEWRKDGRATCYNVYTNYGYSRVNVKPGVSFKGVEVKFNSSVKKGNNAVLRIDE